MQLYKKVTGEVFTQGVNVCAVPTYPTTIPQNGLVADYWLGDNLEYAVDVDSGRITSIINSASIANKQIQAFKTGNTIQCNSHGLLANDYIILWNITFTDTDYATGLGKHLYKVKTVVDGNNIILKTILDVDVIFTGNTGNVTNCRISKNIAYTTVLGEKAYYYFITANNCYAMNLNVMLNIPNFSCKSLFLVCNLSTNNLTYIGSSSSTRLDNNTWVYRNFSNIANTFKNGVTWGATNATPLCVLSFVSDGSTGTLQRLSQYANGDGLGRFQRLCLYSNRLDTATQLQINNILQAKNNIV